jgi:hypothetical protein
MGLKPQKGDILCANRGLYLHYGIYAGNGFVIQYAAEKGDFGSSISVHTTSIQRFRKKSPCYVCRLSESLAGTCRIFSPEETLERAKSRLGEASYNLFSNNCEHFVLWCKTGYGESEQAEKLKRVLAAIPRIGKETPLFTRTELQDEIKEIITNGIFDFFDTVTNGLYDLVEKVGSLNSSETSR